MPQNPFPPQTKPDVPWTCLTAAAFAAGFSLPLGRAMLGLSLVALLADVAIRRRRLRFPPSAWLWLLFAGIAAGATVYGLNPEAGLPRLWKLAWYLGIPVAASLADTRERAWALVRAYVLGTCVLALRVILCTLPAAAAVTAELNDASTGFAKLLTEAYERGAMSARTFHGLHHSLPRPTFLAVLFDRGDLGDSQRLMAGLAGAAALVLATDEASGGRWALRLRFPTGPVAPKVWPAAAALTSLALLLTFKRSSWFAAVAVLAALCFRRIPWKKTLIALAALAAILAAVPATRARMASLADEFNPRKGGRVVMWTKIAPAVMREHPFGVGFRSMTPEMMREFARKARVRHVEARRYHLHSNLVEMATSTGWIGLAAYLAWLCLVFRDVLRIDRGRPPESRGLAWAIGGILAALCLNGLVEYNFADAEIVLAYGIFMGAAAGAAAAAGRQGSTGNQ